MKLLNVTPGWVVAMGALYYVDPASCFWPFCAAVLLHELGHGIALWCCGVPVERLHLTLSGAALETEAMDYRREIVCALAGPAVSLALTALGRWFPTLAVISLGLAVFNLLPVPPLDGGRALRAALLLHLDTGTVHRILTVLGIGCGTALAAVSIWAGVFLQGGVWPILVAALLLVKIGLCVADDLKNSL